MTEALPGQASGPVDSPPSNEANQVGHITPIQAPSADGCSADADDVLRSIRCWHHFPRQTCPSLLEGVFLITPAIPLLQTESRKRLAVEPSDDTSPVKRGAVLGHRLACKKLSDKATIPSRGSAWAAGYDLSSAEECVVPANGRKLVKTDIAIAVPAGTYGRVAPRWRPSHPP